MVRLNPFAAVQKRNALLVEDKRKSERQAVIDKRRGVSMLHLFWEKFLCGVKGTTWLTSFLRMVGYVGVLGYMRSWFLMSLSGTLFFLVHIVGSLE